MAMLVAGELAEVSLIANQYLHSGCWTDWEPQEREAMLEVCRHWWVETLSAPRRSPGARDVIEFLATTPVPLSAWFATWDELPPGPADHHALELCEWWLPDLTARDLNVGFVREVQIAEEVTAWVLGPAAERIGRVTSDPVLWDAIEELRAEHENW